MNEQTWQMYFMSICSIKFHPRNVVLNKAAIIDDAAETADLMYTVTKLRGKLCPSHQDYLRQQLEAGLAPAASTTPTAPTSNSNGSNRPGNK